jgi:hypothetical protein
MPPGPDYTIFAITDLSMSTSAYDGGTSFLEAYATGSKLKVDDSVMNESETTESIDPTYGFADFIQSMDIILVGRRSYDLIMHHNSGHWPYPQKRLIVFTATPLTEPVPSRPDSGKFRASTTTRGILFTFVRSSTLTLPAASKFRAIHRQPCAARPEALKGRYQVSEIQTRICVGHGWPYRTRRNAWIRGR